MSSATAAGTTSHMDGSRLLVNAGIGGLIGGMAMAMFAMVVALSGDGFWAPVRGITSVVFGDQHYGGGFAFGPVVVGAMGHMMNSIILGAIFGAIALVAASKLSGKGLLALGAAYGIALWVVMVLIVANAAQSSGLFADAVPQWAWFLGHMMYGLILAGAVLVLPPGRQR